MQFTWHCQLDNVTNSTCMHNVVQSIANGTAGNYDHTHCGHMLYSQSPMALLVTTITHNVTTSNAHIHASFIPFQCNTHCQSSVAIVPIQWKVAIAKCLQHKMRCSMIVPASVHLTSQNWQSFMCSWQRALSRFVHRKFGRMCDIAAQTSHTNPVNRGRQMASYDIFSSIFTTVSWLAPPSPGGPTLRPYFLLILIIFIN